MLSRDSLPAPRAGALQLGRPRQKTATPDAGLRRASELLGQAFETRIVDDLDGVRWSKLAINCATSTLGAAGGDTLGQLLRHRFVRRLALEIWGELSQVARHEGAKLAKVAARSDIGKLAITPDERSLRIGSPRLFLKHSLVLAIGLKFRRMREFDGDCHCPRSYARDRLAQRRDRTPGRGVCVATPVNRALVTLIHDIVAGRSKPSLNTLYDLYCRTCVAAGLPDSQPALPHCQPRRKTPRELR